LKTLELSPESGLTRPYFPFPSALFQSRTTVFDAQKSKRLRANPKRGIGFEEAQEIFEQPYYLDQRSDMPEQYRAIGWVRKNCTLSFLK
jgi:hypothetical protein